MLKLFLFLFSIIIYIYHYICSIFVVFFWCFRKKVFLKLYWFDFELRYLYFAENIKFIPIHKMYYIIKFIYINVTTKLRFFFSKFSISYHYKKSYSGFLIISYLNKLSLLLILSSYASRSWKDVYPTSEIQNFKIIMFQLRCSMYIFCVY